MQTFEPLAHIADLRGREAARAMRLRIQQPEHFRIVRGVGTWHDGEYDGRRGRDRTAVAERVLDSGDPEKSGAGANLSA